MLQDLAQAVRMKPGLRSACTHRRRANCEVAERSGGHKKPHSPHSPELAQLPQPAFTSARVVDPCQRKLERKQQHQLGREFPHVACVL